MTREHSQKKFTSTAPAAGDSLAYYENIHRQIPRRIARDAFTGKPLICTATSGCSWWSSTTSAFRWTATAFPTSPASSSEATVPSPSTDPDSSDTTTVISVSGGAVLHMHRRASHGLNMTGSFSSFTAACDQPCATPSLDLG